ncbi:MAG: hypothetical protein NC124_13010 [Clostridium sp.]|nr:hypothetical protein [Clostridium sp.]
MENQKMQAEIESGRIRKFSTIGIVLGAASALLSFFCLPAAGILAGVAGLVWNIIKRTEYRTKIGMILSVIGIVGALWYWGMLWYLG